MIIEKALYKIYVVMNKVNYIQYTHVSETDKEKNEVLRCRGINGN